MIVTVMPMFYRSFNQLKKVKLILNLQYCIYSKTKKETSRKIKSDNSVKHSFIDASNKSVNLLESIFTTEPNVITHEKP